MPKRKFPGILEVAAAPKRPKNPSIQHLAGTSKRKAKRAPPTGYVCNICKAPGHWVYLCPAKSSVAEKAVVETVETAGNRTDFDLSSSSASGDDAPLEPAANAASLPAGSSTALPAASSNPRKVFLSGLPFSFAEADIEKLCGSDLMAGSGAHKIEALKMHRFSGSRRCNGQAFVTYTTVEGAQACMRKLHGRTVKGDRGVDLTLTAVPAVSKKQATLKKKKPELDAEMAGRATFVYEGQGATFVVD
jgi:hypothetical protein